MRTIKFVASIATLVFAALLPLTRAGGEEAGVLTERYDGYIEALNASSSGRARILDMIYSELRGPHGRRMQESLREALSRENTLILLGVVEAMAMLGDPADVSSLEAFLATSDKLEVKTQVIRLLPAFCLTTERTRLNYITHAVGYERTTRPEVLEPLRRPPLTRRGRLDTTVERLQARITRSIAAQFDPVAAALKYIDDKLFGAAARRTVLHYVGNALGNDPIRWSPIWAAQGSDTAFRMPDEVEELRLSALVSLSDMGAEGMPEVLAAFSLLFSTGGEVLHQAAFETMAVMCRTAFQGFAALESMSFSPEDAVEGESWRRRRYASDAATALYAAQKATASLMRELDGAVFTSAVDCLGAALSYPDEFADENGDLHAARLDGEAFLELLLMRPDIGREKRSNVARALGELGTARAARALHSILDSPYCAPEEGADGTRMAEAAVDALRMAATGEHSGRDAAREILLTLMTDERMFAPLRPQSPPVGLAHMVLWRVQRLARSTDITLDPQIWRERLGW